MIRVITGSCKYLTVEKGDLIPLAVGIAVVAAVAVASQTGYLSVLHRGASSAPSPLTSVVTLPVTPSTVQTVETTAPLPVTPTPETTPPDPVPYRIFYTDKPLDYPVFRLPENMETFGASEIPWKDPDVVTFAYLEESRGGLTQTFNVPYGLWRVNMTVTANINPRRARFQMVLCYANDGRVIDGMEILNRGTAYRSIQVSNTDMYIIVHTQDVDRYLIRFETPRAYYNRLNATA
jgi:hypothetical protein